MNGGEDRIIGAAFDRSKLLKISKFPMICIYDCPDDYPDSFVARVWDMDRPTRLVAMADTLEEIRAKIPKDMHCIPRTEQDEPCIVEVWI